MNFAISWLLAIIFSVALQSSLVYFISYNGIKPDFVLIFVTFAGILQGRVHGMTVGFFCGLMLDLLNTGMFGFYTLTLFLVGMASGMIQKKVFEDSFVLPFVLVFVFVSFQQLLWNLCLLISGYMLTDFSMLIYMSFLKILYTTLITLPLLFLFTRIKKLVA